MKKVSNRIITSIILIGLFIILTILVKLGLTEKFDTFVYNIVTVNMNDTLTSFYKACTFLGSTVFMVSLCIILFIIFIILKRKDIAFIEAIVLIISTIVNNVVKLIIRRERPNVLRLVTEKSFSFPSGHTMASVSMYGILIYIISKSKLDKRLKVLLNTFLSIIPIFVMLSRVYLGAHFTTDVLGASILSIALLLIEVDIIEKKGYYEKNKNN